jgi:hypothetical protein
MEFQKCSRKKFKFDFHLHHHLLLGPASFAEHLHGLVVVSLDLEVCYSTVALRCGNLAMPHQKVLNGRNVRIGIY